MEYFVVTRFIHLTLKQKEVMAQHLNDKWLESCTEELNLPGSPWYQVSELISKYLAERIRLEGLTFDELAKVRYLLGTDFSTKHNLQKSGVKRVTRPNLNDEKLENLLKDLTLKAAKDAKCDLRDDLSHSPKCFLDTVALMNRIFRSSIETYLHASKLSEYTRYGLNSTVIKLASLVDKESEILGEALVKILQKEPSRLSRVSSRLRGRLLPLTLRRLIYRLVLIKLQKECGYPGADIGMGVLSSDDDITQQGLREAFAKGVKTGMTELKTKSATKSTLRHLIQTSVIDAYESVSGLRPYSTNMEIQKETVDVLNIVYTYAKKYQTEYILWLFPLQITISQERYTKEHSYELAMWLNCVIKTCFPHRWDVINKIVFSAWEKTLTFKDTSLPDREISFQQHIFDLGISADPNEVLDLLHTKLLSPPNPQGTSLFPRRDNESFISSGDSETLSHSGSLYTRDAQQSFVHPVLCVRKWLTHLFVGFCDLPVTMFIWDQLFLYNWDTAVLERACCALIRAILKTVLRAKSNDELCKILLEDPINLELHEIYNAWNEQEMKRT